MVVPMLILQTEEIEKRNNKSKNEDDKCFQYAATVALSYGKITLNRL